MNKDYTNDIQRVFAQHYANERKKLGDSFLAALYNLRLPPERLSQEDKKRLTYIVWLFFELPSTNLNEPRTVGNNRPPGFAFPDGFLIHDDMMGYGVKDKSGMYQPGEGPVPLASSFFISSRNRLSPQR